MRKTLTGAALAATLATASLAEPNILFVLADDMGVDASPCHVEGSSMVRMPTLAGLCQSGMVFENAHAAPVCSPTRAMILTGRYPSRTGVGSASAPLDDRVPSLFDALNASAPNVASTVIGKWHLSARNDLDHPGQMGVPYYYGFTGGGLRDYSKWLPLEQNRRGSQTTKYSTSAITNKAIDWLDQQDGHWFLWLAYNAPHSPFHAPPDELHSFDGLSENGPKRGQDPRKHYFAALEALDRELSRLLQSLSAKERQETIIIFMGDNGTPGQVARYSDAVRGAKGSLYDGGTRVPLVATGPGIVNGRSDTPISATDLFETIIELLGGSGATTDSYSMVPALAGRGEPMRKAAYVEMFGQKSRRSGQNSENGWMIRGQRFALIQKDGQDPELYDMTLDSKQSRNLLEGGGTPSARQQAERLSALRATYLSAR